MKRWRNRTDGPLSPETVERSIRRTNAAHAERDPDGFGRNGKRIDAGTAARVLEVLDAHDARTKQGGAR